MEAPRPVAMKRYSGRTGWTWMGWLAMLGYLGGPMVTMSSLAALQQDVSVNPVNPVNPVNGRGDSQTCRGCRCCNGVLDVGSQAACGRLRSDLSSPAERKRLGTRPSKIAPASPIVSHIHIRNNSSPAPFAADDCHAMMRAP